MSSNTAPPPLPAEAVALVQALGVTNLEMRRLWAFIYETYCCDHAPPTDAAKVRLEVPEFVAALGDRGVPAPEANALFAAACTAGAYEDDIGWTDWALGLLGAFVTWASLATHITPVYPVELLTVLRRTSPSASANRFASSKLAGTTP